MGCSDVDYSEVMSDLRLQQVLLRRRNLVRALLSLSQNWFPLMILEVKAGVASIDGDQESPEGIDKLASQHYLDSSADGNCKVVVS
jgi:hypothetical protein